MAKEKFDAGEFISSLFHYAHDFNYNHIVFEANRYKVSVNLTRRSATYGNADMFYVSADTKLFAPVMSAINGAIEVAELASKQQAVVATPALERQEQVFQFRLRECGHGKYSLDLSI